MGASPNSEVTRSWSSSAANTPRCGTPGRVEEPALTENLNAARMIWQAGAHAAHLAQPLVRGGRQPVIRTALGLPQLWSPKADPLAGAGARSSARTGRARSGEAGP